MLRIAKKRTLLLIGLLVTTGSAFFTGSLKNNFTKGGSLLTTVVHADAPASNSGGDAYGDGCGGGGGCSDGCY